MGRNIEIKAIARDPEGQRALADGIATAGPVTIEQHDTFYRSAAGRLKLRRFADGTGELIHYERADDAGPKTSQYTIAPLKDAQHLHACLAGALGVIADVRKMRTLYLVGRTRIHLDRVEGLGDYIELEVVLGLGESESDGMREVERIMQQLAISPLDLVRGAYVDLLARR